MYMESEILFFATSAVLVDVQRQWGRGKSTNNVKGRKPIRSAGGIHLLSTRALDRRLGNDVRAAVRFHVLSPPPGRARRRQPDHVPVRRPFGRIPFQTPYGNRYPAGEDLGPDGFGGSILASEWERLHRRPFPVTSKSRI